MVWKIKLLFTCLSYKCTILQFCEQGKSFKIKYEIFIDKKKEDIFEIIRVF